MLLPAVAGGASPHNSPSSRSAATTSFACSSRSASSERYLTPPSASALSWSATSRGPKRRKSIPIGRPYPTASTSVYREPHRASTAALERASHEDRNGWSRERSRDVQAPPHPHR